MLLVPLTVRQIHSMQNLQRHAPQMKEIQKKYKTDKKRQQEELMKFYKENNINPAASCLPLLAQFPVFISLYFVLRHSRSIRRGRRRPRPWLGHIVPNITAHANAHWSGYLLLVVYVASQIASTLLHVGDDGQDAADHDDGPAARLRHVPAQLPGRPRHLLGDDEPLDGRPGARSRGG